MAAKSFKKGSGKDEMAKRILESALSTLIAIDTNHNYVLEGSTASDPILTEAGTKLVSSMQGSVKETAGTIGDAIAGVKKSDVKKSDSIIIYDESSQANYRVSFETIAALIVAGAIENGDVLTSTKLWSLMANDSDYQINIAHLRDALADYLTKDKLQGLFRNEGGDAFVSKIFDDEALGVITFLSGLRSNGVAYMMKGLQIGLYQSGVTGFGAKIDENGNGEFESLIVRRFLDVPELRYNRVDVLVGDKWRAPGGGIIESVTPDIDPNTGNILMTGTASLKLEEGEIGCIAVDDICMGIFHDFNNHENNDDATTDDGFGNRTFAGFCTAYFRITEVTATTNIDGVNYYNKVFRYALRPVGGRWSLQIHPQNFMNFVVYGNFTNTSRQSATYETTSYTRMLRAQNTWEFSWANIGMQFGDCSLLANFDTQEEPNERANEASRYLFYIDGDIFHTGVLRRVDSHGRDIIDYYDQGVWDPTVEYFYKDRVYYNGSMWLLVREDTVDSQGVHHGVIGSEPSEDNPDWLAVVYSQSVRSMGHWEATKCPYPVSAIVNLAGILYISNKETSNPPRGLLTGKVNGQTTYLKDKDGKYFLIDENEDNISDDWDVLLDIREMVSGEDAIYINLTNDADSIITDINGNIAPGTEYPTTKGQLYRGSVQITSGITWGVSAVGCSATIAPESGVVVTSNMTDDKAIVTISATYNNITYQKVFTFSKLFGADKYILQPSAEVIQFNPNAQGGTGEYTPSVLTMRAYVIKGGEKMEITSGSGLGFIRFGGNNYYSGMTVTINNMSVFTSGKLTFELFDNQATPQLQDMEEIPLVQDGINGAGSAVINLTNDTDTVCCDSDGNIDPSDSLPITNAQLYYDLDKVTTGLEWHCNCEGCTATIEEDQNNPGEGKVTVTGMSADFAKITIFCNFRGEQYSKIFTFKKLFGADKYYLQVSSDSVVMDKTGSFQPNSITARAYCKRFGNDPVECTAQDFPHIKIACQALQQQSGYSPQSVVITDSVFTNRHLVFTLIDDSTPGDVKILDTEDVPLVIDGTDGIPGDDGKDWHYAGMWDSEAEYKAGDVVRMGDSMYVALTDNTNKPPREILKDGVDGKYLKDENDRYLMTGSDLTDDINWDFYFRDGRDGIDGVDGKDGRDGQDGDTPVFVNLTNDTDSVICDMEGNPLEELPTTVAQFFFGSVQLLHEDGVEWSISHLVGCTLEGENGITDDGYVQVKTMSADRAQVTIRATYKTQYYEKNFNFTKLYGTDKYVLAPNFGTVQFNPNNGSYYPTSLVLNAFVVKNGTTIDLTQASGLGYIQIGNDTQHKYYNGDSIQTATLFAVSGIEITLRDPDGVVKDKEYIPRISDGRRGDDGDDAVTMWFDDSNIHFICDAEGTPVSGQTYSSTGKLYKGGNDVALHASLSKAESATVNCTGVLNVADNTEFILTVTGFKTGATDSNEIRVTLVAADESISREFVIHVDKVRPGADGKSPVIYNVVPNTNVVNKDKETGVFTPATLTPSVRKSYIDANGAVAHQMLSASQALSSEGIHIYYRFDAMIQAVTEAIGNMDNGNPLTLPSSMNSYVNFAIAKSDGIILDNQSVSAISNGIDGKNTVRVDLDNENDTMLHNGSGELISGNCVTHAKLFDGQVQVQSGITWRIKTKTNVTATISDDTVTVTAISANSGSVVIAVTYKGVEYTAILSIKKLVGVDKYEIVTTPDSVSYNGNNDTYSSQSIKVDVYRTKQNGIREKLSTLPSGITLKYTGATGEKSINPGATIPYTDYGTANVTVILRDSDLNVLDNENVPIVFDGINGDPGQSFVSRGHWRSGEEYNVGDMVTFAGSIFRCLDDCANIPPLQCLTDNGNYFLVDENGNYIVNYPLVRDTRHWELDIEYQRRIMFDLDNESDTILYDTNGKKVSQDVVSHAILYVDGAEYVGAATYGINASGCTATISGRTIIVTGVSGTGGTVEVTCTYDGNNYTAILSVRKLVGVNKYEIVPSANSVKKDPNNNNQYTPSAGVTFQIFKTDQTGTRRALSASDMNTGDEEGFRIGLIRGGQPEATIAINYTITPSDFEIGDCRITLYDKNNSVQDSEYIPVISEGVDGQNAIRVDLDNENDSMLYDGSGNLISGNCIANATLYDGETPVTSALTWKAIVRSGSVTTNAFNGTLPGNQLIVSGITSDAATILVYTRYKEYDRGITLTLKRLVGVDKYELSVSPNSVGKDGNTSAYDTNYIAVDVYKTAQNSSRTKLNSLPTGYTLKSIINGVTESINLGSQSIAKAKFAGTNIAIELRDNNNSLLDNENVPIIASGATGKNSVVANALPSSQIINQDITDVTNIDSPNLSETVIMEVWDGNRKLATNEITSIIVSQTNPHVYINDATGTPRITGSITLPTDRFVIKGVGKDGNDQYYSDASISCVVNFTLNGTQKSITVPVKVYVNLLGSWKVIVENGAEQKVGERINYEAGPDGTVLRTAWNANITESATALRSEYTEQIGKASEYGANLFGFSKGVVFSGNIIPFIQGYGFAQSSAGQIYIHDLGFGGKGGYFTISFYARMSSTNRTVTFNFWARGMLSVYNPDAATSDPISFSRGISASSWTRVTQTVYIKSFSNDTQRGGQFYVDDAPGDNLLYIRQLKIERGNEVTAFTPAAEDLAIVGNGQLITNLTNDGMSLDGEVDGRRADYFVYANPAGYVNDDVDYLSQVSEFNITQGKMYTLSFWAKCSSNGMIITSYLRSSKSSIIDNSHVIYDSGTNGSQMELLHSDGMSKVRLSTVWKQYFIHLYATNSVKTLELVPMSVLKEDNTYVTGTIYISDIRFVEGFDTDEGQYKSLIEQTARRISLSVEHDLSQTGIDILHQKIVLRADQVVFASSTGTTGKIWIDATDGSLHAIDGHFSGEITASTGSIGGFIIDSDAIRSSNSMVGLYSGATHTSQNNNSPVRFWAGSTSRDSAPFRVTQAGAMFAISGKIGGFTIGSDSIGSQSNTENLYLSPSFAQIGNNQSYVIMGADVAPGTAGGAFTMAMRIENTKSPQSSGSWTFDTANYGIYINVKNGTKNYGIFSTAPIRGSAVYSDKIKFIQFSGDGYTIDLSQCNIYYFYCTSESRIYLPTKTSIAKQFGYSTLPEDFGVVFTVIAKWDSAAFYLMGVENHNGYITNLGMAAGDVVRVLVTNINGVFVYKILSQYS